MIGVIHSYNMYACRSKSAKFVIALARHRSRAFCLRVTFDREEKRPHVLAIFSDNVPCYIDIILVETPIYIAYSFVALLLPDSYSRYASTNRNRTRILTTSWKKSTSSLLKLFQQTKNFLKLNILVLRQRGTGILYIHLIK